MWRWGHLLDGMEEEPGISMVLLYQARNQQSLKLYCYSIPLDTLGYHCMDSQLFKNLAICG